jgi:predicted N-acyltransferase
LRTNYRRHINRSLRKLKIAGIEQAILTDPKEMLKCYTPEVHGMYCRMANPDSAAIRVEVLPIEFFHELPLRLNGDIELIVILKESRIIAFCWAIHDGHTYHMTFGGLDYQLNREFDLYFNLTYAAFDSAFRKRVSTIVLGMGGDTFKARIGCYSEPLYVFGKGRSPLIAFMIRVAGNLLIAQKPTVAQFNIFRDKFGENASVGGVRCTNRL